jgi:hypothetical protein
MATHGVRLGDHGRLEVVRGAPPEDAARLRATVDRLRRAAGAGAVEIRSVTDDGGSVEVVLAYAGRSPAASMAGGELARVGAALAADLADLHARGLVHGAITRDHVLVDADGAVRVCGFGDDRGATAADDVFSLGGLLRELLDVEDSTAAATSVRGVAGRCCVTDPAARPSMAAVAASLASGHGERRTIASAARVQERSRRPVFLALAIAASAVIAIAGVAWTRPSRAQTPRASTTAMSHTTTTTSNVHATRVWPAARPHVLVADGRWEFGTDDDLQLLGDWDCSGSATPGLLQPDGDLYVIDEWRDDATARLVTTIDDAVAATVEHRQGCDVIVVTKAGGEAVTPILRPA